MDTLEEAHGFWCVWQEVGVTTQATAFKCRLRPNRILNSVEMGIDEDFQSVYLATRMRVTWTPVSSFFIR